MVIGYWVHRDKVYWHSNKDRTWHYLSMYDYQQKFTKGKDKGKDQDKSKSKGTGHERAAPYGGAYTGAAPAEGRVPEWPTWTKGKGKYAKGDNAQGPAPVPAPPPPPRDDGGKGKPSSQWHYGQKHKWPDWRGWR